MKFIYLFICCLSFLLGIFIPSFVNQNKKTNPTATKSKRTPSSFASYQKIKKKFNKTKPKSHLVVKDSKKWNQLLDNDGVAALYEKSKEIFKNAPQGEAISQWISSGLVFDSSQEFGQHLQSLESMINKNPYQNFDELNNVLLTLNEEDHFIRAMILNLVHKLNIEKNTITEFYAKESSRKFQLTDEGKLSPNSINLSTALILLQRSNPSMDRVNEAYQVALGNNLNHKLQKKITSRYKSHFPEIFQ